MKYTFQADVWLYPGMAGWHFITLPKKDAEHIRKNFGGIKRGFGSIKVTAFINKTSWKTSIFPDKKAGSYLLPIKTEIRKKEKIHANDSLEITLKIDHIL